MKTLEIELFDVTKTQAVVYADYQVFDGDDLISEENAKPIQVSDLKNYITENSLNRIDDPYTGDMHLLNVCTYINENLRDVVSQYLLSKHAN